MPPQRPTHTRLHVQNTFDALKVLEAVRIGALPLVTRRLTDQERSYWIRSGSIFVWKESDDDTGIKRWTDGICWSQSRMREPFLFYEEKQTDDRRMTNPKITIPCDASSASIFRSGKSTRPNTAKYMPYAYAPSALPPQFEEKTNSAALVKQAYSAWVTDPKTNQRCKYHLTAYFTFDDLPHIPTVESQSELRAVVIPQGVYRSGKSRTSARNLVQSAEPARTSMPFRAIAKIPSASASPESSPTSAHSGHLSPWTSPGSSSSNLHTLLPETTYPYTPYSTSPAVTPRGSSEKDHQRDRGEFDYAPPPPLYSRASHSTTTRFPSPLLPSVALLSQDTESGRLDRTPEDHRVIQMLNSRHIM